MSGILWELAWSQQGAFSTSQAEDRGVARSTVSRWCRAGKTIRKEAGVYVIAGTPDTPRQRAMVQVLAAGDGARATDLTALGLRCPDIAMPLQPVIAVPRSCGYTSRRADIRRSRDLDLANAGVVDGIPVVGVARALLDASAGRDPDAVVRLIDCCRRHTGLATGALLEALRVHSRRGRPGIAVFREALCRLGSQVTKSEFERLVLRDLVAAGLPEPRTNHVLRLPGEDPMELDLCWLEILLDLELDGLDHVDRVLQARRDRRRDRILARHGWEIPRFMWRDYVCDRDEMIEEIVGIHRRRTAALRPAR